ncbi:MAG: tetratricopeptide (TPR) repeat protein [Candidatus Azotimanducaceae bacterium]|jgi:tetratricopeptide (TPR) repeat protein
MNKISVKLGVVVAVTALWCAPAIVGNMSQGVLPTIGSVQAQEEKKETRKVPAMRERTYKTLSEAQVLIDPESVPLEEGQERPDVVANPLEAIEILNSLRESRGINSYELAQIWNTLAFAYYTLDDLPNTLMSYENVLKQEITEALELSTLRALFQLYYSQEEYKKSIGYMDRWEVLRGNPDAGVTFIKATAYYQLEDYTNALKQALAVERIAIANERDIKETWWYLQVVIYNELKDNDNVINVLEKMIVVYPKKQYWMHLAGMYAEKGQEDKSLSAYYAAYSQGLFEKETEIVMLAQRLLNAEVPFEAAQILELGIKNKIVTKDEKNAKLLATAYTMSQDMSKAIDAWRDAAAYSKEGSLYYRLAQALSNEDRHKEAVVAYQQALDNDIDEKDVADVYFWRGISQMQLEDWDVATASFREAAKDKDKEKSSRRYIKYIAGEKRRQAALREMLSGS